MQKIIESLKLRLHKIIKQVMCKYYQKITDKLDKNIIFGIVK